jgi:3-oxoacyl-[acyl-carrier-protein] synthase II
MKSFPRSCSYPLADEIVITGTGAVCSLGNSVREITLGLLSGKSGISEITDFDAGGFGCRAARVKDPPAIKTDIHPHLAKTMGKHLSLLLISTRQALIEAGIGSGNFDPEDMGFFAGMGTVDYRLDDLLPAVAKSLGPDGELDYGRFFSAGYQEIYPLWPLGMLNNVAFCQAAIHFGLRGENAVFAPHGDAGVKAVAEAVKVLDEGKARVAIAGGVSEEISLQSLARAGLKGLIRSAKSLSVDPAAQGAATEVFLGECGAMLVLEPISGATARKANMLARVAGFGFSCHRDGKSGSASTRAICSAMEGSLSQAGIGPGQVDAVMLGGCGRNEIEAVGRTFGTGAKAPITVSTVGSLGETFAAGPILNTAIGLEIASWDKLPRGICPSGGCSPVDRSKPARFMVNGISYEGMCSSMIIEKTAGKSI